MKKVITFLFIILILIMLMSCSSNTFIRTIRQNFSNIDDYKKFPNRELHASKTPFQFKEEIDPSKIPEKVKFGQGKEYVLDAFLEVTNTTAFLIVKDDTIIYEKYLNTFEMTSLSMSFSVAKSFTAALVGCAIDDGVIETVEQPVTDFVPELKNNNFGHVRIKHLLQMTSGIDYTENDNPFGIHSRCYHQAEIIDTILNFRLKEEPGNTFAYKSGDTLLLGLILSRALKNKTLTQYLQEKIWDPIGMEYGGLWSVYEDGLEKTFCCISARARDYAKFGRLYLHFGNWNGNQIISKKWIDRSTKIDTTEGSAWFYQYGWYVMSEKYGDYRAEGVHGQFIYINPKKRLIIVRLGRDRGVSWDDWREIFTFLADNIPNDKAPLQEAFIKSTH